ncbi:DUF3693 domain-containing protein [Vibrio sp. CCUG 15886]|uniref:DUF3693 domain-containing protein n=1 Tax=Vibrio sp. CCUG 15886 TaxID=3025223 RepID=UPI0023599F64|nr:DUF3693 domain-containing protein [Vibrio sp. CCUG 15886]MDC8110026.1 DUF3693 domain-containing protein [Vibrio sp. CCUG 15886]
MHDGLSLSGISIACGGLAMWIGSPAEALAKCALCGLMLSVEYINGAYETSRFRSFINEVLRNDKKLCFS